MRSTTESRVVWNVVKDILAILVIPLLLWGVRLEVNSAVTSQRIQSMQKEVTRSEMVSAAVQTQALQLARLEEKLDAVHKRLFEIMELVRD